MRELKYAILGLVSRQPATGYDITKYFNDALSKFWEAKHSQIYPELRRLVDEGMIEYTVAIQGEKMEKKLYSLTEAGRRAFQEWLTIDEPIGAVPKDAFRLRLYFCEHIDREELRGLLQRQYVKQRQRLHTLEARAAELADSADKASAHYSEYLLVMGGILRDKAYIDWLRFCADSFGIALAD